MYKRQNGDGSGTVHLTAVADNAITYKFVSNGVETMVPSGMMTYNFSSTGLSTYEVTVIAIGTAGVVSNTSISLDVLVLYSPPQELLDALFANSWRVQAEESAHLGVGPSDGNEPIWYAAAAFDKVDTALYDDRYTFSNDGTLSIETFGAIFGKKTPIDLDYPNNTPYTADDVQNDEYYYYPAEDFSSTWSVSAPGGVESINLSSNGYLGMYVGGNRSYTILERSSNSLHLRTIGMDGNAWYMKLTNEN